MEHGQEAAEEVPAEYHLASPSADLMLYSRVEALEGEFRTIMVVDAPAFIVSNFCMVWTGYVAVFAPSRCNLLKLPILHCSPFDLEPLIKPVVS